MDVILCTNFFLLRICHLYTHTHAYSVCHTPESVHTREHSCEPLNKLIFISKIFAIKCASLDVPATYFWYFIQSDIIFLLWQISLKYGKYDDDDLGVEHFWTCRWWIGVSVCASVWFIRLLVLKLPPMYTLFGGEAICYNHFSCTRSHSNPL